MGTRWKFALVLAYGALSTLELASLSEARIIDFDLISANDFVAIVACDENTSRKLVKRVGGAYKIARILDDRNVDSAMDKLELPYSGKFNWTVSAYEADRIFCAEVKEALQEHLKRRGLGKAKFIPPLEGEAKDESRPVTSELPILVLARRIIRTERSGIDLVMFREPISKKYVLAQTTEVSDLRGFEERDFERPYQDPTITLGPRIARVMVNLAKGENRRQTILDPFCGLGTLLQESAVLGDSVVGVDRNWHLLQKARANLEWCRKKYKGLGNYKLLQNDARELKPNILGPIDAIVTEPILMPRFRSNPRPRDKGKFMEESKEQYASAITAVSSLLSGKQGTSRLVISTPILTTSDGRRHSLRIDASLTGGLRHYQPRTAVTRQLDYPLEVETSKNKIVGRAITVLTSIS